ncbi:MAG: hypothetical protein ABIG43_06940 [Chloroflexota bacterium]
MKTENTKKRLSSNTLTVIGLISVALGYFIEGHSYLAIVGMIVLPMAVVRNFRERGERKSSEYRFGIAHSLAVIIIAVVIAMLILVVTS